MPCPSNIWVFLIQSQYCIMVCTTCNFELLKPPHFNKFMKYFYWFWRGKDISLNTFIRSEGFGSQKKPLKTLCLIIRKKKSFWLHHMACGTLVPWPGIVPSSHALETQNLSHWTTGEVLKMFCLMECTYSIAQMTNLWSITS